MNHPINYQLSTINRKSKGFTLIELLVVISIIAILIAAATASWQNAQQKGRDGKRKADLKAVQQALELYLESNGRYPSNDVNGSIQCNTPGDSKTIFWGQTFSCLENPADLDETIYMQKLPKDPAYRDTQGYYYQNMGIATYTYTLSALLENQNDPEISELLCAPVPPPPDRNYCVENP